MVVAVVMAVVVCVHTHVHTLWYEVGARVAIPFLRAVQVGAGP